jgi:hypothetical protein
VIEGKGVRVIEEERRRGEGEGDRGGRGVEVRVIRTG